MMFIINQEDKKKKKKNRNRVLQTSDLLPNISPIVGQLSVNISLALRASDMSTLRLTSNQ